MEKIAYYFDADFETDLFANKVPSYKNNRFNHFFEHLLFFIQPETVFSMRKYSHDYLRWVQTKISHELDISSDKELILKPFQGERINIDLQKKWQNKVEVYRLLKENTILPEGTKTVVKGDPFIEGKLYKSPYSSSGMGHMIFPRDKAKILKALDQSKVLLEEVIRNRCLDFSNLIIDGHSYLYETVVDKYFHFKGCIFSDDFKLPKHLLKDYEQTVSIVKKAIGEYNGVYSIDSYLFTHGGQVELYPACEINMRKTMSFCALKLKELFAPQSKYFEFCIEKSRYANTTRESDFHIRLSPDDNFFQIFIWYGKSKEEVQNHKLRIFR